MSCIPFMHAHRILYCSALVGLTVAACSVRNEAEYFVHRALHESLRHSEFTLTASPCHALQS
eukprot:6185176-Pleurochrysis_carterae.AAC.1